VKRFATMRRSDGIFKLRNLFIRHSPNQPTAPTGASGSGFDNTSEDRHRTHGAVEPLAVAPDYAAYED
jgi:hypothetical protein